MSRPENILSELRAHQEIVDDLEAQLVAAHAIRRGLIRTAVADERRPSDIARALDKSASRVTVLIRDALKDEADR